MPSRLWKPLVAGVLLLASAASQATPQVMVSPVTRVSLLELYTSEGCSSCPPAEEWLSGLRDDPRLWKSLVPVAFHVDYWDNLGWRDRYDSQVYTLRQEQYAARWGNGVVYTPEFVLNGKPWTNWFDIRSLHLPQAPEVGRLTLAIDGARLTANFLPVNGNYPSLQLHVVLLASGLVTRVGAGENAGRELRHDFLVISYVRQPLNVDGLGFTTTLSLPDSAGIHAPQYALAAWVSVADDPTPIQSVGGLLTSPR